MTDRISNETKLPAATAAGEVRAVEADVQTLLIRANGALPTQDIGFPWQLEAVDARTFQRPPGVQWGFAPLPFIMFAASQQAGGVINLEPQDLTDNPIGFGCQAPVTQLVATAPNYAPVQQTINSQSPANARAQWITSNVVVFTDPMGLTWLRFGRPDDVGIEIDFEADAAGAAGTIAAIQLVNSVRTATLDNGTIETRTTSGAWALDVAPAQQDTFLYLDRVVPLSTGLLQISDSPAQQLGPPLVRMQITEQFLTWLMFRSNTPNANWMPLYLVQWGWLATAVFASGAWTLQSGTAIQPGGSPTSNFPVWQTNIREYHYTPQDGV